MAARDFTSWRPIPLANESVRREVAPSAVVALGRRWPMTSNVQDVPRLLGADVSGGSALTEDTHDGDKITMYSYQFNGKQTLDEADLEDANADPAAALTYEWLNTFNIAYDNSSLGVSGARSSTASDFRPYDSAYRVLTQTDAGTGYTGNANIVTQTGDLTYDNVSTLFGLLEDSRYWNDAATVVIAHPKFRAALREILDDNDRPIFQSTQNAGIVQDSILEKPIVWSHGARVSTNFKMTTVGPRLMFVANRNFLVHGPRIDPQTRFINADINTDALEHTLQHRARKGFRLTIPQAAACLALGT